MRILVVEDDAALSFFLRKGLEQEGHSVTAAKDGDEAIEKALRESVDLIVLDLNLPRTDGIDVLRALQGSLTAISVLVLTGRVSVSDRITCLDLGADDFLQKPFSFEEMLARCRAIFRRRATTTGNIFRHGDLCVDRVTRVVTRGASTIDLSAKEYALLDYLLQHRGRPVGRPELLANVWTMSPDAGTNVVDVYVNYLRRKLQAGGQYSELVETVRGSGYVIRPASTLGAAPIRAGKLPVVSAMLADSARITSSLHWDAA